jgi:hypothetical protein
VYHAYENTSPFEAKALSAKESEKIYKDLRELYELQKLPEKNIREES